MYHERVRTNLIWSLLIQTNFCQNVILCCSLPPSKWLVDVFNWESGHCSHLLLNLSFFTIVTLYLAQFLAYSSYHEFVFTCWISKVKPLQVVLVCRNRSFSHFKTGMVWGSFEYKKDNTPRQMSGQSTSCFPPSRNASFKLSGPLPLWGISTPPQGWARPSGLVESSGIMDSSSL